MKKLINVKRGWIDSYSSVLAHCYAGSSVSACKVQTILSHIYLWRLGETDSDPDCASCCLLQCQGMVGFWDKGTLLSQDTFMFIGRGFTIPNGSNKTYCYVLTFVQCTSLYQAIVAQFGKNLSYSLKLQMHIGVLILFPRIIWIKSVEVL